MTVITFKNDLNRKARPEVQLDLPFLLAPDYINTEGYNIIAHLNKC